MKTQKAIEWLKAWSATHQNENENVREAVWSGIQALKEVEQYRALGTVEELKEAREKQIPKKVAYKPQDAIYQRPYCPTCDKELFDANYSVGYCECGQKIDWEEGGTSD